MRVQNNRACRNEHFFCCLWDEWGWFHLVIKCRYARKINDRHGGILLESAGFSIYLHYCAMAAWLSCVFSNSFSSPPLCNKTMHIWMGENDHLTSNPVLFLLSRWLNHSHSFIPNAISAIKLPKIPIATKQNQTHCPIVKIHYKFSQNKSLHDFVFEAHAIGATQS